MQKGKSLLSCTYTSAADSSNSIEHSTVSPDIANHVTPYKATQKQRYHNWLNYNCVQDKVSHDVRRL